MSAKHLVIVESPAKARSIGKYLGSDYVVKATIGHVIDLPPKELGVDVENGFEPKYVKIRGKGKVIAELKRAAKGKDSVILATDRDREGEMIAFHVAKELGYEKNPERFTRITFGEVTKNAVHQALERGGDLEQGQIDAQQTRRILDRLIGFKVSPFLWRPIRPGLSAGRVQSVALRIICDREDEIRAFVQDEYWSITASLLKDEQPFEARLHHIDEKTIDSKSKFKIGDEEQARTVLNAVRDLPFVVTEVRRREQKKNPPAPFTTSTMQQAASKRLRFSTKRTMSNAQRLYEGQEIGVRGQVGLITYMRTDSTRV
ncbi:MAG TPA: type I DNA topoisomerase, partial [Gemmatimonadetes bacterium]|nr:type I DNA topoisomerase [Gemmatimonadota bacterium]